MTSTQRPRGGAANGNETIRFETTILPHRATLYQAALRLTRNPAEAEDLVQQTLLRAFTRWHTFRADWGGASAGSSSAGDWLNVILRNLFFTEYQRQKRRGGPEISLEQVYADGEVALRASPLASLRAATTPEQATMAKEEFRAVRRAIRRLPQSYGAVLTMAVEEGLLYDQIADRLNLPVGTVRSRLHRARKRMERAVSDWEVGAS